MEIQGRILTISNAPALQKRVKEYESAFVALNWQVSQLTEENHRLQDLVRHYQGLVLTEGKERKKLIQDRRKQQRIKTREKRT